MRQLVSAALVLGHLGVRWLIAPSPLLLPCRRCLYLPLELEPHSDNFALAREEPALFKSQSIISS